MGGLTGDDGAAPARQRLGVFGGTFDPPHYGHLFAANEAAWRLSLDRVLFLPARENPLKRGRDHSPAEHRCRMVELAIADNPRFALSRADLDRPPPSYTVDLLRLLRETHGPDTELYFLSGADILAELHRWYRPDELLCLATLVAMTRPGVPLADLAAFQRRFPAAHGRVILLDIPALEISATDLRRRAREGHPLRYLTPPAVAQYVQQQALYAPLAVG